MLFMIVLAVLCMRMAEGGKMFSTNRGRVNQQRSHGVVCSCHAVKRSGVCFNQGEMPRLLPLPCHAPGCRAGVRGCRLHATWGGQVRGGRCRRWVVRVLRSEKVERERGRAGEAMGDAHGKRQAGRCTSAVRMAKQR